MLNFLLVLLTNLDTINTTFDSYEIKNLTSTGYDIYIYGVRSPGGVERVQFPTWTIYGGQDDLDYSWSTSSFSAGTNLGNGTWKYHVNVANHNNESGQYITHVYICGNDDCKLVIWYIQPVIQTADYVGSLYLADADANFNNDKYYPLSSNSINSNFTYEFDAKPETTIPIYSNGTYAVTTANTHNFIIQDSYGGTGEYAGIGLSIGTNGAVAIAHAAAYYYVLLNYSGDLSSQHRYRFTVKNNIPYLYIDGNLMASGISPISPVTILFTNNVIGNGIYGSYKGWANNFVIYNTARQ